MGYIKFDAHTEIPIVILPNGCACMSPVTPRNYRNIIALFIDNIDDGMKKFNYLVVCIGEMIHWLRNTL